MRAGKAITQVKTIRTTADNHRDRKCRETDDMRQGLQNKKQNKTQKLQIMTGESKGRKKRKG